MSFCICGGYLGSGGVHSYSGRWCRCERPVLSDQTTISSSIDLTRPAPITIESLACNAPIVVADRKTIKLNLLTVTKIYALIKSLDLTVYEPSILEEIEDALK